MYLVHINQKRVRKFQILILGHVRALDVQINHLDDVLHNHQNTKHFELCNCFDRLRKLRHILELIQEDSENAADFKFDFENKRHMDNCEICSEKLK